MTRPADQRFTTLSDLRDSVHGRRMKSRSIDLDLTRVKVHADGEQLVINGETSPSSPTHWAFGQLSGLLKAPAGYLRNLPLPLAVDCLNHGIAHAERETMKFMTISRDEEGPGTLQAVTSSTYGRIWDADVVDAAQRIVDKTDGRFFNPKDWSGKPQGLYASDRDIFVFMIDGGSMVDGGGERDQLNRGFFLWNSEVGARTFGLTTFLFRKVCGNHIVWDAQDITKLVIRHTQNGPYRFDSSAVPTLLNYVNASAKPIEDKIKRAKDYLVGPGDTEIFDFCLKNGKFTRSEIKESIVSAKREEGDCRTLWNLIQGFTAHARSFDFIDARADLESRAGKLMEVVA